MRLKALTVVTLATLVLALSAGTAICQDNPKLFAPAQLNEKAPDTFQVKFETTKGNFTIEVTRDFAPIGADHFYNLVKNGYYNNCRFFRVISNFMVQFGINGNPKINAALSEARIKDDPVKQSNKRGFVTYAKTSMPNSRSTQLFINFGNNSALDKDGFTPIGKVVGDGMKVVDSLYAEYGEGAPNGNGPDQGRIQAQGNAYLEKSFPKMDYIKTATIVAPEK